MKKTAFIIFAFMSLSIFSQNILGHWKTLDSKTKQVNSIVEIYKIDDLFYGKIVKVTRKDYDGICDTCVGKYKNKDLEGIIILNNSQKKSDSYENGKITDPENGKTYSCYLKLVSKNKLKIRGYIGFSLLGRTEYWYRVSKEEMLKFQENKK